MYSSEEWDSNFQVKTPTSDFKPRTTNSLGLNEFKLKNTNLKISEQNCQNAKGFNLKTVEYSDLCWSFLLFVFEGFGFEYKVQFILKVMDSKKKLYFNYDKLTIIWIKKNCSSLVQKNSWNAPN